MTAVDSCSWAPPLFFVAALVLLVLVCLVIGYRNRDPRVRRDDRYARDHRA